LKDIPYSITPVVTTALGIAREEKSLGYATTSISSTTLEKIPEPMMMQALAGQSAGLTMTSGSGRPGAGALINIRGASSFSTSGQPLFVIDGIPVSTNNDSRSDALGTGSSGSRQMDFDMENVDELTVLKGAAATALYGSRAANGAIIIGILAGVVPFFACTKLKHALGYDDALDTFGVHAVGGTLGAFLTGVLATPDANPNLLLNLKDIVGKTLWLEQLKAMGLTLAMSIIGTAVLGYAIKATLGLRPTAEKEESGLDVSDHGEKGYNVT